jgi:periplasmic protein CpxP/Spy
MKRIWKVALAALLVALTLAGARVYAQQHGHWKSRINARLDGALDAAKATPAQRQAILAARDHVFAAFEEGHAARAGEMEEALRLFQADPLDPKALAEHRARKEAEGKKVGDAIVQAIYDAHDALTPAQRRTVVEYVKTEKTSHGAGHGGRPEEFMRRMVDARIEEALDEIKATPAQRQTVAAARDRVLGAVQEGRPDRGADLERVLALFAADRIDGQAVAALRAEHEARMHAVTDAVVQAITQVHQVLSAQQRQALVDFVRAHHRGHHG